MLAVLGEDQLPVAAARAGEPAAWDALFRRYQLPLYVYVYELLRQEQTALDVVQETFINAARHLGSLRDDAKFGSWLFGIAHQKCQQHWRKPRRTEPLDEHYNETPVLFEGFLERRYMAYTMAWYGSDPASVRASEASLEDAQAAKFELAAERIGLKGNERILNIGCGFGALETWLFERYPDLEVVSLTPSQVHVEYMKQCMANPDHVLPEDRIKMVLNTLEGMTELEMGSKPFDMVFAFGVFEHMANLTTAFQKVHDVLRPGGRFFVHLIVSKPAFPEFMNSDNTLSGRYFPGGRVWPYDILPQAAGKMQLVNRWYINGTNYLRTLDEWHRLYWENMDQLYPHVLSVDGVRYWNDYFTFAKSVMFGPLEGEIYGNGHYVFERPL